MLNLLDLHRPPVQKESSIVVGPSRISLYLLQPGQTQRAKSSNNNIRLVQFSQSSTPISEDQSLSPVEAPPPPRQSQIPAPTTSYDQHPRNDTSRPQFYEREDEQYSATSRILGTARHSLRRGISRFLFFEPR
ncbi:hypothetical protein I310_00222 [Cryptococcus deuterogattii CA1014]|nr:hypothetical protein I310_00222 [Cryptococcus deuterogattii CA1014]